MPSAVAPCFADCSTPIHKFDFILCREKDIDEKLARMDIDLKAWRSRVETRERNAQKERRKREQILKEVRFCSLVYWSERIFLISLSF